MEVASELVAHGGGAALGSVGFGVDAGAEGHCVMIFVLQEICQMENVTVNRGGR
jgi:hypothetical protein